VPTQAEGGLVTVAWAGDGDPGYLLRPSPDSERFFTELAAGRFVLRFCPSCSRPRYPHAPVCPYCGTDGHEWRPAPPDGRVLSWARCHLEFVPEFAPLLPYVVLDVQLSVGVRIIARLAPDESEPFAGMEVRLAAERWPGGAAVPIFVAAAGESEQGDGSD
jgi:uncharacterized protein